MLISHSSSQTHYICRNSLPFVAIVATLVYVEIVHRACKHFYPLPPGLCSTKTEFRLIN